MDIHFTPKAKHPHPPNAQHHRATDVFCKTLAGKYYRSLLPDTPGFPNSCLLPCVSVGKPRAYRYGAKILHLEM